MYSSCESRLVIFSGTSGISFPKYFNISPIAPLAFLLDFTDLNPVKKENIHTRLILEMNSSLCLMTTGNSCPILT